MKPNPKHMCLFLFVTFFKIALFVVGGGLAMLPVIGVEFSQKRKLITKEDVLEMVSLTQTVPGLIAVNSAVFVGNKLGGWRGSVCAVAGVICPSLLIILTIAICFPLLALENKAVLTAFDCVRASVSALFLVTVVRLSKQIIRHLSEAVIVSVMFIAAAGGVNSIYLILIALIFGILSRYSYQKKDVTHG